jgi:hypothetical protein
MAGNMTARYQELTQVVGEVSRMWLYTNRGCWQKLPAAVERALHYTTEAVLTRLGSRAMSRCCWDLQGRKEGSKDTCGITVASRPSYKPACVLVHVLVVVLSEAVPVTGSGTLDNTGSRPLAGPSTSACCEPQQRPQYCRP